MFHLVIQALRGPRLEGEAVRALLGAKVTKGSLAVVGPGEMCPFDLRWSRCGVGHGVDNEKVSVGPKGLVVIYVGTDVFLQVNEAVCRVVYDKFVRE